MSAPVVTATPDSSPWAAWSSMATHGVRHLVVTVGGRCVGLVDDREVFAQWPMGPLAMRRLLGLITASDIVACVAARGVSALEDDACE